MSKLPTLTKNGIIPLTPEFLAAIFGKASPEERLHLCTFPGSPADGNWTGQAWRPGDALPELEGKNAYFSVALLKADEPRRLKDNFLASPLIVLDDAGPDAPPPSYKIETSSGNFQCGYLLTEPVTDRNTYDLVMKALGRKGMVPADTSGNNSIRYVRLPAGINGKADNNNFAVQLAAWHPERRYSLEAFCEALSIDLEVEREQVGNDRLDREEMKRRITTGEDFHEPINRLAASYAASDQAAEDTFAILQGLMKQCGEEVQQSERWNDRFNDIGRAVASAYKKFAPAPLYEADAGATDLLLSGYPTEEQRPCYRLFNGFMPAGTKMLRPGVWHFGVKMEGQGNNRQQVLVDTHVSGPLAIVAEAHDEQNRGFGMVLKYRNRRGRIAEMALPRRLLAGDGASLTSTLFDSGLEINLDGQRHLLRYLNSRFPKRVMLCVSRTGWHGDSYILPDRCIGSAGAILQTENPVHNTFTIRGTVDQWCDRIGIPATRNPIMVLSICAAFAGPLLKPLNMDGGGIHVCGPSSVGKSTTLETARSVWGPDQFRRSWKTTANGFEGIAEQHNDCLLPLDELSEANPDDVPSVVYALGNGRGKTRAHRTGDARAAREWCIFVLSNGEKSVETMMLEAGERIKAGQVVRLLDIPCERQFGIFDDLHGRKDGAEFSNELKLAADECYGATGQAFLERMVADIAAKRDLRADFKTVRDHFKSLSGGEGQHMRVADRCALLAFAGELATTYGLTGWPEGEATKAAEIAYQLWATDRTKGTDEKQRLCRQLLEFIERHGDSRFSKRSDSENAMVIHNRAGWYETINTATAGFGDDVEQWVKDSAPEPHRIYYFNGAGFDEATKGFDRQQAFKILVEVGALPPPITDGGKMRHDPKIRVGSQRPRLFPIDPRALA